LAEEREKSLEELLDRRDELLRLQKAIKQRLAGISESEKREVEALSQRALNPKCGFDRRHKEMLYMLALSPEHVSWHWKIRERLHRIVHDH
jgi:hypothetical protein